VDHQKANWYQSVDGKTRVSSTNREKLLRESAARDYVADDSWKLPVPYEGGYEHLIRTNATSMLRCIRHKAGRYYG
jgi:hypothetical protein